MPAIKLYFHIKKCQHILTQKVAKEKCYAKVNAQNIPKHCPATIFLVLLSAEKKLQRLITPLLSHKGWQKQGARITFLKVRLYIDLK